MLTFWIIAALMILLALWFVLPALLQAPNEDEDIERREANVLVYKDQYRELQADFDNGLIGDDQYNNEKTELERRLLEDVVTKPNKTSATASINNKFAYAVALFVPIGAIALYLTIGNAKAVDPVNAPATVSTGAPQQAGQMSRQQIAANIEKLADRLLALLGEESEINSELHE